MLLKGLNASPGTLRAYRQQYDAKVLAQGKQALLGYAAAYPELTPATPPNRGPGRLPCPDRDNDGDINAGTCSIGTGSSVGRFPWLSLGVPALIDSSGERLWYAVSDGFRNNPASIPINSEVGGLSVNGQGDIVAVIFAPGSTVQAQTRDPGNINNRLQYLEGGNEVVGTASFVGRVALDPEQAVFNDHVAYITRAELMDLVEKRVAGDARAALRTYYSASGANPADRFYPNAAMLGKGSPHRVGWHGLRRGALPLDASEGGCECDYVAAANSLTCTCSGTAKYEFSDAAITFLDDAVPGICMATANSCVCTGTGPAQTDSCVVSGLPTFTVTRADEPAIFTDSDGACVFPPPLQLQDLPTICACTGDGSCDAQTSQHANTALSGLLLPVWFDPNDWEQLIYYTFSQACRADNPTPPRCTGAPQLQLGAQSGINALVATTGRTLNDTTCNGAAVPNQARPSQNVCNYLDSDENTDVDDTYGQQLRSRTFNDYLREVSPP